MTGTPCALPTRTQSCWNPLCSMDGLSDSGKPQGACPLPRQDVTPHPSFFGGVGLLSFGVSQILQCCCSGGCLLPALPGGLFSAGDITMEGLDKDRQLQTGEIIIIVAVLLMWAGECHQQPSGGLQQRCSPWFTKRMWLKRVQRHTAGGLAPFLLSPLSLCRCWSQWGKRSNHSQCSAVMAWSMSEQETEWDLELQGGSIPNGSDNRIAWPLHVVTDHTAAGAGRGRASVC